MENFTMDKAKRFKKVLMLAVRDRGFTNITNLLNKYDFEITDAIAAGTVEVNGNTVKVHSDLLQPGQFNAAAAAVIDACKAVSGANNGANNGASKPSTTSYVIATKYNPTATEKVFYQVDMDNFDFTLVDLSAATVEASLGRARFNANNILSMSDLHRIYILDANTLAEVDSLDYYNDYEDENDYPGYFDESCDAKSSTKENKLKESYTRTFAQEFKQYENLWN
jgi:hypothetical protein